MKNCFFIILLLFSLFTISCSNNQSSLITYDEENTLKININERAENIIWTKEIEGDLLTENIKKNHLVLNNTLSPTIMNVLSNQYDAVYPFFEDFGNLDTRNLSNDVRTYMNDFCESLSENVYSVNDSFFSNDFIFTYVFFIDELSKNWNKYYHTEFPVLKPETKMQNDSSFFLESEAEDFENTKNKAKLFTSWIFGEPFNGDDYIQIPVRFFTRKGNIDTVICLTNTSPFKIFNIEIKKWEVSK